MEPLSQQPAQPAAPPPGPVGRTGGEPPEVTGKETGKEAGQEAAKGAGEVLIRAEGLSRLYGPVRALDGVSFELRRGEVLGLLGPNGAGKTTTLEILSGNLAPTTGGVWIDGVDLLERPLEAKARLGYLPDQPPLYRELTVDEFLHFCARLHRVPRGRRREAVAQAKERCGLAGVGRRLIGNLSKGYRQRVGIAQAIVHNPRVVILDEPTVGLDPLQMREIRQLIRELAAEHTVLLSTHILPEVQAVCSRVQIIHRGRLVVDEDIEGLARRMRSGSLILGLRRDPGREALLAVPGVEGAEPLGEGPAGWRWRLHFDPERDPAEELARRAVEQGWGLRELTPERLSLEEVFVELTQQEGGQEGAGPVPQGAGEGRA